MFNWPAIGIRQKVLLAHIGDVRAVVALCQQVVEWLILMRSDIFRDCLVPFLAIGEDGIDIKDHTAKIEHAMANNITNSKS